MKKIILGLFILISLFLGNTIYVNAEANCSGDSLLNEGKLCSSDYMINTTRLGLGGDNIKENTAKGTIENGLSIIVKKMMIAFGILALFIMTIGGGYMILAGGKDDMLNKGKAIFSAGLIALLVALGSAIIMKLVIYLLY